MASSEQVRGLTIHPRTFGLTFRYKDTIHIFRTLNNTARVYKNKVAQEVVRLERRPQGAKFEDVRDLVSGARGRVSLPSSSCEKSLVEFVTFGCTGRV